jgi:hypothetical protein
LGRSSGGFADNPEPRLAMTDQSFGAASAKRTPAAEQKDRFQEGRLSRRVSTPDKVLSWVQQQLCPPEASNVLQGKLRKTHRDVRATGASA